MIISAFLMVKIMKMSNRIRKDKIIKSLINIGGKFMKYVDL